MANCIRAAVSSNNTSKVGFVASKDTVTMLLQPSRFIDVSRPKVRLEMPKTHLVSKNECNSTKTTFSSPFEMKRQIGEV